ncbi:MAG TPA: hypothetical protein PLG47_06195, partial [Candidatus Dojkabacteria bacterium]|nr:hypothetical protein [Candidatus Dojkabacteria bacterium]
DEDGIPGTNLSAKAMKDAILNPDADFVYIQLETFRMMEYLDRSAQSLQTIQSSINTDSKGLDKGLIETMSKEDAVMGLSKTNVVNVYSILGNLDEKGNITPTTIWGYATVNGLLFNNKLWSTMFPYQQNGIQYLFDKIEQLVGKGEASAQVKSTTRRNIWKNFKSYIYSLNTLGLLEEDINAERKRLSFGENSLANKIKKLKTIKEYANNPLISRLVPETKKNGMPALVKINAAVDQAGEMSVMQAALELYTNDRPIPEIGMTTKELFVDLMKLAYLTGGVQEAIQYVRFMPVSYLFEIGMADRIAELVGSKEIGKDSFLGIPHEDMPSWVLPNFVRQYIQHNTAGLTQLDQDAYSKSMNVLATDNNVVGKIKVTRFALTDKNYLVVD